MHLGYPAKGRISRCLSANAHEYRRRGQGEGGERNGAIRGGRFGEWGGKRRRVANSEE